MKNVNKLRPEQPITIVKELLKVEFSHDEVHVFGDQLARTQLEIKDLKNQKKSTTSGFDAKINAKVTEAESLSNKIATGHEYRMIECEEKHNDPNVGMKTITRKDTRELVATKSMSAEEMQLKLDVGSIEEE